MATVMSPHERPPPAQRARGQWTALVLALFVNLLFVGVLVFSVSWQNRPPQAVTAELYAPPPPVVTAPRRAEPKPQPTPQPKLEPIPPKPEPAPPTLAPLPKLPEPAVAKPDTQAADIAQKAKREAERARQDRRFPTALITTPESLSLMLTREHAHDELRAIHTVIVDEWHELMGSKRGVQVQLALARLRNWNPELVVWGLSATMGNLQDARSVLLGAGQEVNGEDVANGVLVEGDLVCSCLCLAASFAGREIVTIEGVAPPGAPSDVQQAFVDAGAVQCGFCTPGLIVAAHALLERNAEPSEYEIREELSGNICRCTGYGRIIEAVQRVAVSRSR